MDDEKIAEDGRIDGGDAAAVMDVDGAAAAVVVDMRMDSGFGRVEEPFREHTIHGSAHCYSDQHVSSLRMLVEIAVSLIPW